MQKVRNAHLKSAKTLSTKDKAMNSFWAQFFSKNITHTLIKKKEKSIFPEPLTPLPNPNCKIGPLDY